MLGKVVKNRNFGFVIVLLFILFGMVIYFRDNFFNKTIELFGGNCKLTELIFKKLNLSEKITKDNYQENLEKFFTSNYAREYSENLLRAIIMLHYSIKTNTYPKTNGKMSYDIFKPLERL